MTTSTRKATSTKTTTSPVATPTKASSLTYAWKVLYQNDANWTRALDVSTMQTSYLLFTGNVTYSDVENVCLAANETPVSINDTIDAGLQSQLQYLFYDQSYYNSKSFWIENTSDDPALCSALAVTEDSVTLTLKKCKDTLPVICTNSAPRSTHQAAYNNDTYAIEVNNLTAYRDAFSFRFMRVPYANTPIRFAASTVYNSTSRGVVPGRSSTCPQAGSSATEDCLVANVYTPVITSGKSNIRPKSILVWIHGGGFNTGSGQDPTFDGGSMASRGDVIVITPNYRLGTLGFLPINNQTLGNYGVSDIITLLQWVQLNAATFGGDKTRVTIAGQSAGAQIVATLLSTQAATGLYSRAIMQSGRPADAANQRMSLAQAVAGPANRTITQLGCANATDVLVCLQGLSVKQILSASAFNNIITDGTLVTEPNIDVARLRNGYVNQVPVIMGFMRDEMGSLGFAPSINQSSLDAALKSGGVPLKYRNIVEGNSTLFPVSSDPNGIQNLTVTVETDTQAVSRCGQESTMYSAATNDVFSNFYTYTQDQRAYQLLYYDPYRVCLSTDSATSGYYFCHSGDLYSTFNTAGYVAQYPVRDSDDIIHAALQMDMWASFSRSGNPNPSTKYLSMRGYTDTAERLYEMGGWAQTTSDKLNILSLGPYPEMQDLAIRGDQCSAYGLPLDYIAQGG
jgi:carboxylesterase type B